MSIVAEHVSAWRGSPFNVMPYSEAWDFVGASEQIVSTLIEKLGDDYRQNGSAMVHKSAIIEDGALLKGPLIIGERCFVAAGSLLRGGCWIDEDCIIGPGAELKSTIMFRGSKLAHFNFVGDSLLGQNVNIEAGAIIANYRNEIENPDIKFSYRGDLINLKVKKFGALIGDGTRIGANAVIAPGAILTPKTIVKRLALIDQRSKS